MHQLNNGKVLFVGLEPVDKAKLDSMPNLRVIGCNATGLDHIDLVECKQRDIKVISLRDYPQFLKEIPATAEHTIALLLSLIRQIPWAYGTVLEGIWERNLFNGYELKGKSILIIGYGRIGRMVAKYSRAFGMKVITINKKNKEILYKLLPKADFVSLHIHLEDNEGYFNRECFDKMKKGSIFINTSRGGIVDEDAILESLKNKTVAGAALDVMRNEPEINKKLLEYAKIHSNLLLTPHIGGRTIESTKKTREFIQTKIEEYLKQNV